LSILTASSLRRAGSWSGAAFDVVVLAHDERRLRRKVLRLEHEGEVLVDFAAALSLEHGDALALADGRLIEVIAAEEELLEVTAHSPAELSCLCWHIGNRHLAAQIEERRILILRDHVIKAMLEGLGAHVREVSAPFQPMRGAYAADGHSHHGHGDGQAHGHSD
jgi:urease accessory protein